MINGVQYAWEVLMVVLETAIGRRSGLFSVH